MVLNENQKSPFLLPRINSLEKKEFLFILTGRKNTNTFISKVKKEMKSYTMKRNFPYSSNSHTLKPIFVSLLRIQK